MLDTVTVTRAGRAPLRGPSSEAEGKAETARVDSELPDWELRPGKGATARGCLPVSV